MLRQNFSTHCLIATPMGGTLSSIVGHPIACGALESPSSEGGAMIYRSFQRLLGRQHRWATSVCALTGALGIATGFALFLVIWGEASERHLRTFFTTLVVATVLSCVVEKLREWIQHPEEPETPAAAIRIMSTVILLLVCELCVIAWHKLVEDIDTEKTFQHAAHRIMGPSLVGISSWVDALVLAGMWVAIGAVVAGALYYAMLRSDAASSGAAEDAGPSGEPASGQPGKWPDVQRALRGAAIGCVAGAIVAPIGVFAYVLTVRMFGAVTMLIYAPHEWYGNLDAAGEALAAPDSTVATAAVAFARLLRLPLWIIIVSAISVLVACVAPRFTRRRWPFYLIVGALLLLMVAPLLRDFPSLVQLSLASGLIWGLPGALLGAMTPFLRDSSPAARRWWAWFATGAAIALLVPAIAGVQWWLLILSALSIAAGILFFCGARIEHIWPLAALSMATAFCAATIFIQATFADTLHGVRALTRKPAWLPHARIAESDTKDPRLIAAEQARAAPPAAIDPQAPLPVDATVLEHVVHLVPSLSARVIGQPTAGSAIMTMSLRLEMLVVNGRDRSVAKLTQTWAERERAAIDQLAAEVATLADEAGRRGEEWSSDEQHLQYLGEKLKQVESLRAAAGRHRAALRSQQDAMLRQLGETENELVAIDRQLPDVSTFTPVYNALQWTYSLLSVRGDELSLPPGADAEVAKLRPPSQAERERETRTAMRRMLPDIVPKDDPALRFERTLYDQAIRDHIVASHIVQEHHDDHLTRLARVDARLAAAAEGFRQKSAAVHHVARRRTGGQLELALAGSFGFWVTVGLLASGTLAHSRRRPTSVFIRRIGPRLGQLIASLQGLWRRRP
jgi:hypothetical protein